MIHAGARESVWLLGVTLCPRVKQMWWPEILLQVGGNNCQNWDSGSVFLALQSHPGISSDPAARLEHMSGGLQKVSCQSELTKKNVVIFVWDTSVTALISFNTSKSIFQPPSFVCYPYKGDATHETKQH